MTPSRAERAGLKRGAVRAEACAAGFGRSTESASEQAGWHREVPATDSQVCIHYRSAASGQDRGAWLVIENALRSWPRKSWVARLGGLLALGFASAAVAAPNVNVALVANPASTTYAPGTSKTFEATISNGASADAVDGLTIRLNLPSGATFGTVSCAVTTAGTGTPATACGAKASSGPDWYAAAALAQGGAIKVTFEVNFPGSFAGAKTVGASSIKTGVSGANDTASIDLASPANLGVAVAMFSGTTPAAPGTTGIPEASQANCPADASNDYTPGCISRYRVAVTNGGAGNVEGAQLSIGESQASDETTMARWACFVTTGTASCPTGTTPSWCPSGAVCGTGEINNLAVNLRAGAKLDFTVVLVHKSAGLVLKQGLEASIQPADPNGSPDNTSSNDTSKVERNIKRVAKVVVNKVTSLDSGETTAQVNTPFDYFITLDNQGPSDIGNIPTGANDAKWPTLLVSDDFATQLIGVSTPDCVVSGNPAQVCWRYCANTLGYSGSLPGAVTADSGCPVAAATGTGDISQAVLRLKAHTSSRVQARVAVANPHSGIVNTASASMRACNASGADGCDRDITLVNDSVLSDEVTVQIVGAPERGLAVTVDDNGGTAATPGLPHSWKITVLNTGQLNAANVSVDSQFPIFGATSPGFAAGSTTWQCRAFGGACCDTGNGQCGVTSPTPVVSESVLDRNGTVSIPAGGRVEYTVNGLIDPRSEHGSQITFSAEAARADAAGETWSDTDDDTTMQANATLGLQKQATSIEAPTNQDDDYIIHYDVRITNLGPSYAQVALTDPASGSSSELDWNDANWTCAATAAAQYDDGIGADTHCGDPDDQGTGALTGAIIDGLVPGGELLYSITVPVRHDNLPGDGSITNTASVVGDGTTGTVVPQTAKATSFLWANVNLQVNKTDGLSVAHPGTPHSYDITIVNHGPDDALGVEVEDLLPAELQDISWTCSADSPVPGDLTVSRTGASNNTPTAGPASLPGHALAASADGSHIYVLGTVKRTPPSTGTVQVLYAFQRNPVPGLGYGEVGKDPIDLETDGADDPSDSGSAIVCGNSNTPDPCMDPALDVAVSADGRAVYVLSTTHLLLFNRVSNRLDPAFGSLSFGGALPLSSWVSTPRRLVLSGSHAYVSGVSGGTARVVVFKLDASSLQPTQLETTTTNVPNDVGPLALSADGAYLFAASKANSRVARFAVQPASAGANAGKLIAGTALLFGNTTQTGYAQFQDIALAANGTDVYLLAHNGGGTASRIAYLRVQNGALEKVSTYPEIPADNPSTPANEQQAALNAVQDVLATATRIALAPDGEHLIGVNPGAAIDGSGSRVFSLRRSPYSGSLSSAFEQVLSMSANPADDEVLLDRPIALAISSDNRHVFLASSQNIENTAAGPLVILTRRAPDPVLGFVEHDPRLTSPTDPVNIEHLIAPTDMAMDADGKHLYAISLQDSSVLLFDRRAAGGPIPVPAGEHLKYRDAWRNGEDGVDGIARPERIVLSPDGAFLFVTSLDNDTLAVFSRNASSGDLTFLQKFKQGTGGVAGLLGAHGIAVAPGSQDAYIAGSYGGSIARFRRNGSTWNFVQTIQGGDGVTGLSGIRDLAVTSDGKQLIGVAATANTAVVFDRDEITGALSFRQALSLGSNQRPMSLALSPDDAHVYVVAQNSSTVHVLARVRDDSPAAGSLRRIGSITNGSGGVSKMQWPRDVAVSANGEHVYVAAESGDSLVAFTRYGNAGNSNFGLLEPLETRTDEVDGVRGIASPYAVMVSPDGENIYIAGFDSDAIASFSIGGASTCSASGTGNLIDTVRIRAGGAVNYTINSTIRPDAEGTLTNTVAVNLPAAGSTAATNVCAGNSSCTDETQLRTSADLVLGKTNNQTSMVPGTWVTYDVTVRNDGPGNVTGLSDPSRASVSDLFDCAYDPDGDGPMPPQGPSQCFVPSSIQWTCSATSSGTLDFVAALQGSPDGNSAPHLSDVSGMALIGSTHLAAASVSDDAVSFFRRDAFTGALSFEREILDGQSSGGQTMHLAGARSVATNADGTRLYVASRISDSLSVFDLSIDNNGNLVTILRATKRNGVDGVDGLDQALHLVVLPSGTPGIENIYVAAANSHAVSSFGYDANSGELTQLGTLFNGQGGVTGLADVEHLVASPGGDHVYALSGSSASVSLLDRNANGSLSWRLSYTDAQLLAGVSSGSFDAAGKYFYLTASTANRIVVLPRKNDPGEGSGIFGTLSLSGNGVSSIGQAQASAQAINNPRRALVSPDGQHLYVTSQGSGAVAWFSIHPQTGALGYLGVRAEGNTGIVGMAGATGLIMDAELGQLYVSGALDRAIVQFARQSDSWCPPSGTGPLNNVGVNIAAGGQIAFRLTAMVSSDHSGELGNVASVQWTSDGGQSGCTNGSCQHSAQDIDVPSISADLSITKDDGLAEYDGLAGATSLAGVETSIYAAAAGDNAIGVFLRVAPDPNADESARRAGLVFVDAVRSGDPGVSGLAGVADVIATEGQVYAASPVDNTVVSFARGADGVLTPLDLEQDNVLGVTGLAGARALALSPDGVHLYAAGSLVNALAVFRRDVESSSANHGKLDFVASVQNAVGGVSGLTQPVAVAVSPDGKHVYAVGGSSIAAFARNTNSGSANFGRLTFVASYANGGSIVGLNDVRSIVFNADGAHLYVLGATAGTLVHFSRDAQSGVLSFVERITQTELIGATRLRLSPDGQVLHAAGTAADAIVSFMLGAGSGTPKLLNIVRDGDPVAPGTEYPLIGGLDGVSDLLVMDAFLYASAAGDGALSAFDASIPTDAPRYLDSMFDGLGGIAPGDTLTYVIRVENHGPSDVEMNQARVVDIFPPQFHSVSWVCVVETIGAAACQSAGPFTGNIDTRVQLAAGGSLRFEATAQVGATATGRLINTATITSDGVLDPDLTNNSATDGDTVLSPSMNLSIIVDECPSSAAQPCTDPETAVPGGSVTYRVQAINGGPSYADRAVITDALPSALYDVSWTCEAAPHAGLLTAVPPLQAIDGNWRASAGDSAGRHLYVVGTRAGTGEVALFLRNMQSGALTEYEASWSEGSPSGNGTVRGIAGAVDVVLSPDGRFLYVAGHDADAVAVFSRDTATGALTWKAQVRDGELGVDGIGGVTSLAISPDGRHLYAGGASDQAIGVFAINLSTGLLTQTGVVRQGQNGVNGLNGVADLAFNASGTTLFAAATTNRSLTAFRRNISSGALNHALSIEDGEPDQPVSLQRPNTLLVADGSLFVGDAQGNRVSQLHYQDVDNVASFELMQELPQAATPQALVYVQDQARLYVAVSGGLRLYSLLPESARLLASYNTALSSILTAPAALLASPDARHLYVASANGVGAFLREVGSRCPLAGEGSLGTQQVDIAPNGSVEFTVQADIFANAAGQLVYSAGVDPRVLAYESDLSDNRASDADQLTPQPDLEVVKTRPDGAPFVVAGTPVAYRIDVLNHGVSDALAALIHDDLPVFPDEQGGLLADSGEWTCAANPPLVEVSRIPATLEPRLADLVAMAHTPDGSRLFGVSKAGNALVDMTLAADGSVQTITRYVDGDMAGDTAVAGLAGASHVAVSPDGDHLYVTGSTSNSVLAFAIEDAGLTFLQKLTSGTDNVAGLQGAAFVMVSGDGRHVYTAAVPSAANNSAIALFQRNPATGLLTFDERIQDGLGTFVPDSNVIRGVRRLHLTADGSQLYAISTVSQSLARFSVDAGTGRLSYLGVMRASGADAVAELVGVRDFVVTPGDTQFYVLGTGGISRFNRAANGSLAVVQPTTPLPGANAGRALTLDAYGSRLYLADAAGAIHMYWRNWNDGALELRHSIAPAVAATTEAVLHAPPRSDVYLATGGADGALAQFDERAISRCLTTAGNDAGFPVIADMGVTGWASIDYAAMVHPSARGTLSNTASATPGDGSDPVPGNSSSTDSVPIHVVSDLSIAKTGPAGGIAGEELTYVITVNNAGPSDALGIHVRDDLLGAAFLDANWTCSASGGSSCEASGSGNAMDVEGDLLVGDVLTVTLHVRINPATLGAIQNTAYVMPEPGATDPSMGDHSATPVTTQIERRADIAVSKSNTVSQVVAGEVTTYAINVSNLGPSDAPTVSVIDELPAMLQGATWVCTPSGGAQCPMASGTGSIDQTVSIPAQTSVVFTLTATLSPAATGQLSNMASVALIEPGEDPISGNNLATDTDTVLVQSDVMVSASAPDRYDPQSSTPMVFDVDVANLGASNATGVSLSLAFNHAVQQDNPACTPASGTQFTCTIGTMAVGGSQHIMLGLMQLPAVPANLGWSATVSSGSPDPQMANNSVNGSVEMASGIDLDIGIDDDRELIQPGDSTLYTVTVRNLGSADATAARVQVPIATGFLGGNWTCTASGNATCAPSGTGSIDDTVDIAAGASLTYRMTVTLDPAIDQDANSYIEQAASVAVAAGGTEVSVLNNQDSDSNEIVSVLFKDGFEGTDDPVDGEPQASHFIGAPPAAWWLEAQSERRRNPVLTCAMETLT